MNLRRRSKLWRLATVGLWLGALSSGCQSEGEADSGAICERCDPNLGGETGDFGGSLSICGAVARRVSVAPEQVPALGFDLAEIERRLARPIEAPLYWSSWPWIKEGGADASGYQAETRVQASIRILSYEYNRPDPAFCDGTVCRLNGEEVVQATCATFLALGGKVEFATADGAVRGSAEGEAVQWHSGFEAQIGQDTAEQVYGHFTTSLHAVAGTLRVTPDPGGSHYQGQLWFEVELDRDTMKGTLFPEVEFDTETRRVQYHPLIGSFPSPYPAIIDAGASRDAVSASVRRIREPRPQ